ncbi:hypothetical protein [Paraburkholderia solisilvae]|uniref:Uncharacterized protein n=1 Tax=Paraburkholderia solisilvae TaxID=624376 RepID=A0A6J5D7Z9_9BURK|nr:hypothetical protein [Paraburkholderia solisilvae]CAB3749491.1 hypothetical protein LMG29739_00802 [Paraburkholderia solisilvae]
MQHASSPHLHSAPESFQRSAPAAVVNAAPALTLRTVALSLLVDRALSA